MGIRSADSKLRNHLNASKGIFGDLSFSFAGSEFRLNRISANRGSFAVLETYCPESPKLIIGHEESKNFTRGKFLILPEHKVLSVKGVNVLIGCDDDSLIKKAEDFLFDHPYVVPLLFNHPFSHITISSRINIGFWPLFERKNVLEYTGLPETAYEQPHEFELYLKSLMLLKHHLFEF
jgi:hypothetical protein